MTASWTASSCVYEEDEREVWRKGSRALGEGRKRSRKREKRQKSGKGSLGRGTNENTKEERSWNQTCMRGVAHIPGP